MSSPEMAEGGARLSVVGSRAHAFVPFGNKRFTSCARCGFIKDSPRHRTDGLYWTGLMHNHDPEGRWVPGCAGCEEQEAYMAEKIEADRRSDARDQIRRLRGHPELQNAALISHGDMLRKAISERSYSDVRFQLGVISKLLEEMGA